MRLAALLAAPLTLGAGVGGEGGYGYQPRPHSLSIPQNTMIGEDRNPETSRRNATSCSAYPITR